MLCFFLDLATFLSSILFIKMKVCIRIYVYIVIFQERYNSMTN